MVDRKQVTDDWRVHTGVDGALALRGVVVPVHSQVCGVEAGPLSRAQVDLQGDCTGATVNHHVRIVYEIRRRRNEGRGFNIVSFVIGIRGKINMMIQLLLQRQR